MNTNKEIHALNRVLYLLEENSVGYLAKENNQFDEVIRRLYRDVSREISELER
jgi:hypothetical protein